MNRVARQDSDHRPPHPRRGEDGPPDRGSAEQPSRHRGICGATIGAERKEAGRLHHNWLVEGLQPSDTAGAIAASAALPPAAVVAGLRPGGSYGTQSMPCPGSLVGRKTTGMASTGSARETPRLITTSGYRKPRFAKNLGHPALQIAGLRLQRAGANRLRRRLV